jgi:uncharacterized damage-inducible protein DinB
MKELLLQYAQYNVWTNKLIIDAMLQLPQGAVDREVNSSFPSLRKTVEHTWSAESIWLQRLHLAEHPIWYASDFTGTFEEACRQWEQASAELVQLISESSSETLLATISYHFRNGNAATSSVHHVLHHVFNHSTYHRGQLVTMLRQVGATVIPGTDFIAFSRLAN